MIRGGLYGYICDHCQHPSSDHRLRPGDRLFSCLFCDCRIRSGADATGLNEHDFRAHLARLGISQSDREAALARRIESHRAS